MKIVNIEEIREKFACGDDRAIMDFLLLQLVSSPGQDFSSMLPLLLLADTGRHGRSNRMGVLVAALFASQQQQQAQAAAAGAVPPTTSTNIMPILAALLFRDFERDEREVIVRPIRAKSRALRETELQEDIEAAEGVEEERRTARKK